MVLSLTKCSDFLPLVLGGITSSGIMSTCVQQDDASVISRSDILNESLIVQSIRLPTIISIPLKRQARVLEDGHVIAPRWVWNVNLLVREEARQKRSAHAASPRPGQRLHTSQLGQIRIRPIGEAKRLVNE